MRVHLGGVAALAALIGRDAMPQESDARAFLRDEDGTLGATAPDHEAREAATAPRVWTPVVIRQ